MSYDVVFFVCGYENMRNVIILVARVSTMAFSVNPPMVKPSHLLLTPVQERRATATVMAFARPRRAGLNPMNCRPIPDENLCAGFPWQFRRVFVGNSSAVHPQ